MTRMPFKLPKRYAFPQFNLQSHVSFLMQEIQKLFFMLFPQFPESLQATFSRKKNCTLGFHCLKCKIFLILLNQFKSVCG